MPTVVDLPLSMLIHARTVCKAGDLGILDFIEVSSLDVLRAKIEAGMSLSVMNAEAMYEYCDQKMNQGHLHPLVEHAYYDLRNYLAGQLDLAAHGGG